MKLTRRDLALDRLRHDLWRAAPLLLPLAVALWTALMVIWGHK